MSAARFLLEIQRLITRVEETQLEAIREAACWFADAMAQERLVHLFGTGHSALPVMECFPRIGSFVGWHPMLELPMSYNAHVVGDMGMRQNSFLERVPGYAEVILSNYEFDPRDVMLLFSHSGINNLIVEMALGAKKRGLRVVAVTSLEHSRAQKPSHASGLRLFEVADLVIDNCAPNGDALVEIEGLESKVGSASTITAMVIVDALVCETAAELMRRGVRLLVYPSHNIKAGAALERVVVEQEERVLREFRRRTRML
jgi:uncharacterized phosphosugar-binding protein